MSDALKPGQHVRVELTKQPRAKRRRLALNWVFRHDKTLAKAWSEHNGEPRKRAGVRIPRLHPLRRRVARRQRYTLKAGAACELAMLNTQQINDLKALGDCIKVTVVGQGPAQPKVYSFGF